MNFTFEINGIFRVERTTGIDSEKFDKQIEAFRSGRAKVSPDFLNVFLHKLYTNIGSVNLHPATISPIHIGVGDGSETTFSGTDLSSLKPIDLESATLTWTSGGTTHSIVANDSSSPGDFSQKTEISQGQLNENGTWSNAIVFEPEYIPDSNTAITLSFDRGLINTNPGFFFDLATDSNIAMNNMTDFTEKLNIYDRVSAIPTKEIDWFQSASQTVLNIKMDILDVIFPSTTDVVTGLGVYCKYIQVDSQSPKDVFLLKSNGMSSSSLFEEGLTFVGGASYNMWCDINIRVNK
jgi:hypothetical protein